MPLFSSIDCQREILDYIISFHIRFKILYYQSKTTQFAVGTLSVFFQKLLNAQWLSGNQLNLLY